MPYDYGSPKRKALHSGHRYAPNLPTAASRTSSLSAAMGSTALKRPLKPPGRTPWCRLAWSISSGRRRAGCPTPTVKESLSNSGKSTTPPASMKPKPRYSGLNPARWDKNIPNPSKSGATPGTGSSRSLKFPPEARKVILCDEFN